MFYTHSESYSFPNTPAGQAEAENWANILRRIGIEPSVITTTTSIKVGYTELIKEESK